MTPTRDELANILMGAGWNPTADAQWDRLETALPEIRGLLSAHQAQPDVGEMVNKFLGWKLPKDFYPDCGISFDGRKDDEWNKDKSWPIGTNLLSADQAKQMFRYVLSKSAAPVSEQTAQEGSLLGWAIERWTNEVANRPLINVHRRTLDSTWRQVIRYAGGDDVLLVGPRHDDLVSEQTTQEQDNG